MTGRSIPQRLVAISMRPEHVVAGQLHGAISDPVHPPPADGERSCGF
jgi:hypothetical protein